MSAVMSAAIDAAMASAFTAVNVRLRDEMDGEIQALLSGAEAD